LTKDAPKPPILDRHGNPYVNTKECFLDLCETSLLARYNDLIPDGALIDRRNSAPIINMKTAKFDGEVYASTYNADEISVDKKIKTDDLPELILSFGDGSRVNSRTAALTPNGDAAGDTIIW
jgi:hypothetical protein